MIKGLVMGNDGKKKAIANDEGNLGILVLLVDNIDIPSGQWK